MMRKIIVVGAVAGGATCASQIRRLDKDSEITIFEKTATWVSQIVDYPTL